MMISSFITVWFFLKNKLKQIVMLFVGIGFWVDCFVQNYPAMII